MRKLVLDNYLDRPLEWAVEPWAFAGALAPDDRLTVEYESPEDCQVEVSMAKDGCVSLGVFANRVKIYTRTELIFEH